MGNSEAVKMRVPGREPVEKKGGLSGSSLKLIAVATMLIDHIGAAVVCRMLICMNKGIASYSISYQNLVTIYMLMRYIGRVAFPIYCFMLVEGFEKTRNVWGYALRLAGFAIVSEIPFDLAFSAKGLEFGYQNVFFTLALGLMAMIVAEAASCRLPGDEGTILRRLTQLVVTVAMTAVFGLAAWLLKTDYSYKGICCIMILYYFRKNRPVQIAAGACSFLWETTAPIAFLPIAYYNGERGLRLKYFFYFFYPVHLLILYLVCVAMGIGQISPL